MCRNCFWQTDLSGTSYHVDCRVSKKNRWSNDRAIRHGENHPTTTRNAYRATPNSLLFTNRFCLITRCWVCVHNVYARHTASDGIVYHGQGSYLRSIDSRGEDNGMAYVYIIRNTVFEYYFFKVFELLFFLWEFEYPFRIFFKSILPKSAVHAVINYLCIYRYIIRGPT